MADAKSNYINNVVLKKQPYDGPKSLFKYRPFDDHTFDMLENNYVFLCKVSKLDDKSECITTINEENIFDFENNGLKRECVEQLLNILKPYSNPETFELTRSEVYSIMNPDCSIRAHFLLDITDKIQALAPGKDISPIINWLIAIPRKMDEPQNKEMFEKLISVGLKARELMGVCSLSELDNSNELWNEYADNKRGYCIEYDFSDISNETYLLPVFYQKERNTNIVIQVVASFIGQIIRGFSNNEIQADVSQFLRLFTTKYDNWSYQCEWRLIGDANQHMKAPKIKKITIGEKASLENINKMRTFCETHKIKVEIRRQCNE